MADTHIDGEDLPRIRPQPLALSMIRSAQAYKSVALDEIELTGSHEVPNERYHCRHGTQRMPKAFEHLSRPAWLQKLFWKDTLSDVRSIPWGWLGRRFLSHMLPLWLIAGMLTLLILMSLHPAGFTNDTRDFCKPDGTFSLSFDDYTPWKRNAIFAINLSFGKYTFSEAKLIDVSWDVGVGRGGQMLLAAFSYVIFTRGLSRTMEASSVSYDTFKAVTLQNDTIVGVAVLIKDFLKTGGRRAKVAMVWTILAGLFVLFVPTWLSAMTGYTADIKSFIQDKDSNLLPAENFRPVIYTIHDGARFGDDFTDETLIAVPWLAWTRQLDPGNVYYCSSYERTQFNVTDDGVLGFVSETNNDCKWLWAVSNYVSEYGFLGNSTALNTTFYKPNDSYLTTPVVFSPALNISAHFAIASDPAQVEGGYPGVRVPYGQEWQNPDDGRHTFNVSNPVFWDSFTLYNLTQFNSAGSCQQQGLAKYKWGFSFLLLYVFVITFLVWTLGMWAFYLDSWLHSRLAVSRQIGLERAVLDLSISMQSKVEADQVEMHSNSQLRTLVKNNRLTYLDLPFHRHGGTRWSRFRQWWRDFHVKQWAKDEKWWLCAMLIFSMMFILSFTTPLYRAWVPYFAMFPGFGVFLVIAVGRKVRSRWLLFAFWFLLFLSLNFWYISLFLKYYL